MKKKTFPEGVAFDRSHIPAEFVAIGELHGTNKRHHNAVLKACMNNQVRRIRLKRSANDTMGYLYVHQEDAADVVAASDDRHSQRQRAPMRSPAELDAGVTALCEINNGITLMLDALNRLTAAVESIATQPKAEPAGTWRDMNGESL